MKKTFKDLRESAPSFVRTPADKAIWNKSVLLNPKNFSEPTKDDNVFKAANMPGPNNKNDDHAASEDQSQGYATPYMFGDYLNALLAMEEVSEDGMAFVEAVMEMDEESFLDFMAEEIPADLAECMMEGWGDKEQKDYDNFKKKRAERPDSEKAKDADNNKKTVAAFAKEEAEQVDEISNAAKLNYIKHAQHDAARHLTAAGSLMHKKDAASKAAAAKHDDIAYKRQNGINHAAQKIAYREEAEQVDELMAPSALGAYASHQGAVAAKFHAAHSKQEKEPIHKALRAKALSRWHDKLKPGSKNPEDVVGAIEPKRNAMALRKEGFESFSKVISLIK